MGVPNRVPKETRQVGSVANQQPAKDRGALFCGSLRSAQSWATRLPYWGPLARSTSPPLASDPPENPTSDQFASYVHPIVSPPCITARSTARPPCSSSPPSPSCSLPAPISPRGWQQGVKPRFETVHCEPRRAESQFDRGRKSLPRCLESRFDPLDRPVGQPGTRFTWSTKVKAKTVSLALSEEQADWLEKAIAEHRRVKKLLAEMRRLSRQIMRARFPDTERRRPLNRKVLRLI